MSETNRQIQGLVKEQPHLPVPHLGQVPGHVCVSQVCVFTAPL